MLTEIVDRDGCGGLVAFTYRRWDLFECVSARDAVLPNGVSPKEDDPIICYTCGRRVNDIHELEFGRSGEGLTSRTFYKKFPPLKANDVQ